MSGHARNTSTFNDLAGELETVLAEGLEPWPEGRFESWARRVFELQFAEIDVYRGFCEGRSVTPASVARWDEVPAVPATAFKHLDLVTGGGSAELVFETSGTTEGSQRRGRHLVRRGSLYEAALLPPFRRWVLDERDDVHVVSAIPSPAVAPTSSLSHMVGCAAERLGDGVTWLLDGSGRVDEDALAAVTARLATGSRPIALLGTALAFTHLLERGWPAGLTALPAGSTVMETGGFKGVRRSVSRGELHAALANATGVPVSRIVNEYGMTELLSQLYEPVLREGATATGTHVPPPWLRVRAVDPQTLEPMAEGEVGLLSFFDVANLGSVAHVLTSDLGAVSDGRVRLEGRAPGAEPRGCSRAMDELMASAAR